MKDVVTDTVTTSDDYTGALVNQVSLIGLGIIIRIPGSWAPVDLVSMSIELGIIIRIPGSWDPVGLVSMSIELGIIIRIPGSWAPVDLVSMSISWGSSSRSRGAGHRLAWSVSLIDAYTDTVYTSDDYTRAPAVLVNLIGLGIIIRIPGSWAPVDLVSMSISWGSSSGSRGAGHRLIR